VLGKGKSIVAVDLNADQITVVIFIAVFAVLSYAIFDRRPTQRDYPRRRWQKRSYYGARYYRNGGDLHPVRTETLPMVDPTVQLNHVMSANFRKRRILNKTEARVFFAVEKALEQTDTGWRVMAQVNLGEILESDDKHAFMAINSKRVDVLVIGTNGTPIAAIEYQGGGHYQGTAAARDAVKKEALRKAGIGYFEVKPGDKPEDVRRMVARMIEMERANNKTNTSAVHPSF
jgi:hypothetical protein